jgi:regulator of G-protein signaling
MRAAKWSFGLKELLSDPTGLNQFVRFCASEFTSENLVFYQACQEIKFVPTSKLKEKVDDIIKFVF